MSRRQELFDAVKTEILKITVATVSTLPRTIVYAQDEGFPFMFIEYASETKETAAMAGPSAKQNELEIQVVVYVRDATDPLTALNTQIANIETEIEDDLKLGKTYVVFARVVEVDMVNVAAETSDSGGAFFGIGTALIRITYRHQRAVP